MPLRRSRCGARRGRRRWKRGSLTETQVSFRSARDQVRLAGTLAAAPIVAEKMADGELSVDNVRLFGAVVGNEDFDDDAELLVEIASGSPKDTRRGLESWLSMVDQSGEAEREELLRLKRHLTFTTNGEGMYDVKGLLMPEDVAHIETALGSHRRRRLRRSDRPAASHPHRRRARRTVSGVQRRHRHRRPGTPQGVHRGPVRDRRRTRGRARDHHRVRCHGVG